MSDSLTSPCKGDDQIKENNKNAENARTVEVKCETDEARDEIKINKRGSGILDVKATGNGPARQLDFKALVISNASKTASNASIFSKTQSSNDPASKIPSPKLSNRNKMTFERGKSPKKDSQFQQPLAIRTANRMMVKSSVSDDVMLSAISTDAATTPRVGSMTTDDSNYFSATETDTKSASDEIKDETPYKPSFQMPSGRRLPQSSHRFPSSSSTTKKCRSAIENEFRSQKILFTTPTAVSRTALAMRSNIGFDDSLNCYEVQTPPVKATCSPIKEESKEKEPAAIETETKTKETEVTASETPENILRINGKDFVIQKKIGQGGSSSVYLAEHKESRLQCALKVSCQSLWIRPNFIPVNSRLSTCEVIQHWWKVTSKR